MSIMLRRFFMLVMLYFPLSLFAQEKYAVLLNSGKFVPGENIGKLRKNAEVFSKSQHQSVHYLALQFTKLPTDKEKASLAAAGFQLIDYIPNNVYTVAMKATASLDVLSTVSARSLFQLSAEQKTVPALLAGNYPAYAIKQPGTVDVTLITYEKLSAASLQATFASLNIKVIEDLPVFRSFTLRVPKENLKQLVAQPFAQWVEFIDPPNEKENLLGRTLHRVNVLNDGTRNLKGDGLKIGIWDENEVSRHLDFSPTARLNIMEPTGVTSSHSTHCAGTIGGKGIINPKARGMAPNATIHSYNFNGNIQSEMATAIPALGLSVSSHSYGSTQTCGLNGAGVTYSATSRATDLNLNNFKDHLHVHSAGNSQTACAGGWSTITASGKSSKNNILVANITTTETLSGSSSCGPVQDGRVKPEISSFGTGVLSTYTPLNTYGTISGTSMATPGVAGTVALLVQRYKQLNSNNAPLSSLIKNTICNTAADLGNAGPDYRFGYGRLNALEAVRILEQNRYAINTIATGSVNDFTITVPAGAARVRVMLTWNDPAGTANANPALVNNLNLSLINGATTSLPWILDPNSPATPATTGVDNVSNIEQVAINNPAAGVYTVRVEGASVPSGPQEYTVTWLIDQPFIEVIYPNGNESFEPGVAETITWNNAGVTGTQTVEYSLDNGANWTTISSSVAANTTRLSWTPPAAHTSTALVRVSAAGITPDVSDANFKIMGIVSNLNTTTTCTVGAVAFTWTAVTNATHYDLLKLDETTGNWDVIGANVTGTTYTASGLTPNASLWFTIIAKNNTTGAIGERALAINRTVSATGLPAIGNISGQSSICGAATNVVYSVPAVTGATSYTWTVPAGASIVSGQGTTSITVNYTAGTTGDITVFASSGACQTSVATLPITSGSGSITAPVSGGDQSQLACPSQPVPVLTATANVAAGHTVVWYTTSTGSTVVASPTWNTVGSITYYAASRNTASGCESLLRTGVTLTISNPAPVSIAAGGPVTFCQGGNVVLTASAGTSYLWSTGATTQSITATTAGSYTVAVTQAGCTIQSPATTVTVNALPVAAIAASGATSFCQGGNVVLTASPGSSYLWSTGAVTQSITVAASGSYTVKVTNANNCSNTSAATVVNVSPQPQVSITVSPYTKLYPGLNTTLSSTINPAGTYTYNWYRNGIAVPGATNPTLAVTLDRLGTYSLIATNAEGCSNVSNLVAIGDSATNRLFIYPSPNNGQFQVSYYAAASAQAYQLVIYDGKGAKVYHNSYTIYGGYDRMPVDLRRNGKGTYQVVVFDKNGKSLATGSVVVQ